MERRSLHEEAVTLLLQVLEECVGRVSVHLQLNWVV